MRGTTVRGTAVAGLVIALIAGAGGPAGAASRAAAAVPDCGKGAKNLADVDGDGRTDTLVGVPAHGVTKAAATGAVDVHGTASGAHLLTPASLGAKAAAAGGFGSAIAVTDLDGDGCVDAVIGAPDEVSDLGTAGAAGPGQVYLVFGGPHGLDAASAVRLPRPATSGSDGFGSALALVDRRTAADAARDHYLYVGAPGTTVDGRADAGQVWRYRITAGGAGRVTATVLEARHPGADGVPGVATAGDRFGAVLAPIAHASGGVLVGVPRTDVATDAGPAVDAGAVWSMPVAADGTPGPAARWTQGSGGVPGRPESGDRFGAALGSAGRSVVVGGPGEDVGTVRDAGLAQVFTIGDDGNPVPRRAITQSSPGIPGASEAGDRFGSAVAVGGSLDGPGSGTADAAIGVPGEDLGSTKDVGSVLLVPVSDLADGDTGVAPRLLRQGKGLQGRAEAGDGVGSVLATAGNLLGFDEDYTDLLTIGVPGEDVGDRKNAGLVQSSPLGLRPPDVLVHFSGGDRAGNRYGAVLPSSAD
ncbi:hypothetical protein ACIB24_09540 [Spongisporangium articulatum]|uniref:FG-GAP repeat protein n=1 Tax=Spongisporangium articulatum TaxID=3362603 RepID=A0ABW8AMW9_9ACTN